MFMDRRSALFGTVAWWFARRYIRRRASLARLHVSGEVATRRRPIAVVLGVIGGVAIVAVAFVVVRKLTGGPGETAPLPETSAAPLSTPAPVAASAPAPEPPSETPPPPAAA